MHHRLPAAASPPAPAARPRPCADIPLSNVQLYNDLLPKTCSDPKLSEEDQFFCKRCCSLKSRERCLGTVGRKWNDGAGEPRVASAFGLRAALRCNGRPHLGEPCMGGAAGRPLGRGWSRLLTRTFLLLISSRPAPYLAPPPADTQSCSWMSRNEEGLSVREVEYSIGEATHKRAVLRQPCRSRARRVAARRPRARPSAAWPAFYSAYKGSKPTQQASALPPLHPCPIYDSRRELPI